MKDPLWMLLEEKGRVVHSVAPDTTVVDAVNAMNAHRLGAVLVVEQGEPVGIFTERDVLRRVVTPGLPPASTLVGDVMTREVIVVTPTTTVEEAMAIVTEKRCRHLPVVEQDRVTGMISIGDLTRWVTRGHVFELQQLINYITDKYPA
ncbi:MAG TPA: CBS domain-containing protein [bacterium]